MYPLKPILVNQNIELPTSMYNMKAINLAVNENVQVAKNSSESSSEVDLLEERQNRILKRLDELKQTLISMRGDLNLCSKPSQQKQSGKSADSKQKEPIDTNNLAEMVLNVHPKNVPYSVLAFKNLWKGRLFVDVQLMVHSSISDAELTPASKEFADKISSSADNDRDLPTLKLIIIWKDVETTQFISSPSKFLPVYGEVNIIRFLNRIGPKEFYYETDNHNASLHDQVLDICYLLSKKHSNKDRLQYIQQLSQRLGKNQFYNASSLSISDIAVSSVLKKIFVNNFKELPANMTNWIKKISTTAGY